MTEAESPRRRYEPRIIPRRDPRLQNANYPFHLDQIQDLNETAAMEDMTVGDDVKKFDNQDFLYILAAD